MKYNVTIEEIRTVTVTVEANTENEARAAASAILGASMGEMDTTYDRYSHPLDWKIEKASVG